MGIPMLQFFFHFSIKKECPKQHGQGNLLEIFLKMTTFQEKIYEIAKISFLEDLGRFLAFFL